MAPHMICRVVELTGYAGVRHVDVSVPLVPQLLDGKRYFMKRSDLPRLEGTELYRARAPRAPSSRFLVRLELKCESAEQLGKRLRRRYQRQALRRAQAGHAAAEAELADQVERMIAVSVQSCLVATIPNRLMAGSVFELFEYCNHSGNQGQARQHFPFGHW
jgi:hypothetical protein